MAAESPVNGLDQTRQIGLSDGGGGLSRFLQLHISTGMKKLRNILLYDACAKKYPLKIRAARQPVWV